jgi:predicted nucleotidyltransferase
VDPRSSPAGALIASPAGALERLAAHSAEGFPNLLAARERTARRLAEMRARVAPVALPADASIVLFGSWGRGELTAHSDDDWLLLVDGPLRAEHEPIVAALRELLGAEDRKPGTQQVFGAAASAQVLARRIGLDEDTNRSLTRRMLLLLESVPVAGDDAYERCWVHVLDSYLEDATKDFRPPRFLLNDLVRYWRTICVDFVGKQREDEEKWGLRNAKLRTGRKVLFAAGLLPILLCDRHRQVAMRGFLVEQLRAPATDRLAAAFAAYDLMDSGGRALDAYDRWIGMIGDDATRAELAGVRRDSVDDSDAFAQVRRAGRDLEAGLLALLFETPLVVLVREYGVF